LRGEYSSEIAAAATSLPYGIVPLRLSGSSWNFDGDPDGLTVRR